MFGWEWSEVEWIWDGLCWIGFGLVVSCAVACSRGDRIDEVGSLTIEV